MGYGITRIYSPDDGRAMGLQGMINDLLEQADFPTGRNLNGEAGHVKEKDARSIGRLISAAENFPEEFDRVKVTAGCEFQLSENSQNQALSTRHQAPILGITGTGGAGKSSLVDELVRRFLLDFPTRPSPSFPWTPASAKPAARCSATASG